MKNTDTIRKIVRASLEIERAKNVPAELIAAQCALESGWLDAAPGNNCFGIKLPTTAPKENGQLLHTTEWFTPQEVRNFMSNPARKGRVAMLDPKSIGPNADNRQPYIVKDWFKKYDSIADCFADRAALFEKGVYGAYTRGWRANKDLPLFVRSVARTYATSPVYADTLMKLINDPSVVRIFKEERLNSDPLRTSAEKTS